MHKIALWTSALRLVTYADISVKSQPVCNERGPFTRYAGRKEVRSADLIGYPKHAEGFTLQRRRLFVFGVHQRESGP
jgi:hypothetical protein